MRRRILTIDGGGIKGVFPASFLANIEKQIKGPVSNYFDLVVGTSTGGILALGLGLGFSGNELLQFYKNYGERIFAGNKSPFKKLFAFFYSKFNQTELRNALEETFGDKKLGDSKTRLVIPSLNLTTGEVYIHKTAHHERFTVDYKNRAVDVALSTSAAPTYFPAHLLPSGSPLIDGGVWANNPIGIAVAEAIGILKWPADSLEILSLGCTSSPIQKRKLSAGKGYWALRVSDLFLRAQASGSQGIAAVLTSHQQICRIEEVVAPGRFELDSHESISDLEGLGESSARKNLVSIKKFFDVPADHFEPYYKLKL